MAEGHTFTAIMIFVIGIIFLLVAVILSGLSAEQTKKKNYSTAERYSIGATVLVVLGMICIFISFGIYIYGIYPAEIKAVKETASDAVAKSKEYAQTFAQKYLGNVSATVPVPMTDLLKLQKEYDTPEACPIRC